MIKPQEYLFNNDIVIGLVTRAFDGIAEEVELLSKNLRVDLHTASVPYLNVGDSVLITTINNKTVILDKMRESKEPPVVSFRIINLGHIKKEASLNIGQSNMCLTEQGQIKLSNQYANLVLSDEGAITIDTTKEVTINGSLIYLN